MRIAIVGKFPPIQGGVSAQVLAAALDLSSAGHDVHIITNAELVEPNFRVVNEDVQGWCNRRSEGGGAIRIHNLNKASYGRFIPASNEYALRLTCLGVEAIEKFGADVIVGWYFVPYGVAAANLARHFSLPLVMAHAGSDLFRLSKAPELRFSIGNAIKSAHKVLTFRDADVVDELCSLGVRESQLQLLGGGRLADFALPLRERGPWSIPERPVVLHYSKISESKGTYDLVRALAVLAEEGLSFEFRCVRLGWPQELADLDELIRRDSRLAALTKFMEPVPPWKVSELIRNASIVAVLERNFSIEAHSPRLAREVLGAGRCLLLSREVAKKQPFYGSLVDGKTAVIIDDPRDIATLASCLRDLIPDRMKQRSIARHGQFLSESFEDMLPGGSGYARGIMEIAKDLQLA